MPVTKTYREIPVGIGRPDSWCYRPLPDSPPVASNSATLVADLIAQSKDNWHGGVDFSLAKNSEGDNKQFSHTMVVSGNDDPLVRITEGQQGHFFPAEVQPLKNPMWAVHDQLPDGSWPIANDQGDGIARFRIPADMPIPDGTDHGISVYDEDNDQLLCIWGAKWQTPDRMSAAWGAFIANVSQWDLRFDFNGVPPYGGSFDPRKDSGTAAIGVALAGYVPRIDEWLRGEINHPVGFSLLRMNKELGGPATRTDGKGTSGNMLAQGQYVYLPRDVNLNDYHLHPMIRTLAKAAQDYGLMCTDTSTEGIGFNCSNPSTHPLWQHARKNVFEEKLMGPDVYDNWFPNLFNGEGKDANGVKWDSFPLDKLVAAPLKWVPPVPSNMTPSEGVELLGTHVIPRMNKTFDKSIRRAEGLVAAALAGGDLVDNTTGTEYLDAAARDMTGWWANWGGNAAKGAEAGTWVVKSASDRVGMSLPLSLSEARTIWVTVERHPAATPGGNFNVQVTAKSPSGDVTVAPSDPKWLEKTAKIDVPADATALEIVVVGVDGNTTAATVGAARAVDMGPVIAGQASPDLTAKLDKPTGKTGQLVYNATTGAWEAAPTGGGVASGGTELVHQATDGSWPGARPSVASVIAAGNPNFPSDPPGWLTDADLYLDISGQGAAPNTPAWVFPTANPSLLSKFEMAQDEATLSRRANTGTEVTFSSLGDAGYFRGGGKVWTNDWYGQTMYRPGSNGESIGTSTWAVSVTTDSQWIVLNGNCGAISGVYEGYLQVVVDGQIVWDTPQATTGTYDGHMAGILIEFPDAKSRTVDIYTKWTMYSIGRAPGSSLAPGNPAGRKKVALLGDSWTQGTDQAGAWKSYAHVVQQTTPGWDVSFNGLGGTGWSTTGTDPWTLPFAAALRQHCVADGIPDLIVAYGSINDQDSSSATVKTRVQEFLSGVASISPTSKVLIVGPEMERPDTLAAMQTITASNLLGVVDPSGWFTSADLGPSDMAHPNAQGVRTIAGKMIATIKEKTGW